MTNTNGHTIQEQFATRCDELLTETNKAAQSKDALDNYLGLGAGERVVAGDHEERHLLELLQNARDAIYRGRLKSEQGMVPGRVYIAVTEHGMAMANTGDPFRLNDGEVLRAVRLLQRSEKNEPGFIGHKGVGLKSILLRAGAFAVRSRIDGEVLRAIFSRSHTADHLLEEAASISKEQERYVQQQLPRLPLFTQPHADAAEGDGLGPDTSLVEALIKDTSEHKIGLADNGKRVSLSSYTTVVYLPYQDEQWQDLLEATEEKLSPDDLETFAQAKQQSGLDAVRVNADELWQELVNLDRRMLVLLGEIGELQFARFEAGILQEVRRIDVKKPLSPLNGDQEARPRRITMREQRWSSEGGADEEIEHTFVVLSSPTELGVSDEETSADDKEQEPREHIRILLEIPDSDHTLQNEPLFLYYPIETERSGMPFIIHGPFRVNSSRTALVKSQKGHNQEVLDQAIALLKRQLPDLLNESQEIRRWLPWILLPLLDPEADGHAEGSRLQIGLCKDVIELLRNEDSVPTTTSLVRPEEVHFFPERPEALLLLEDRLQQSCREEEEGNSLHLLAPESRETYQHLYRENGDRFSQAAQRIGLGQVSLMSFVNALAAHFDASTPEPEISARTEHARSFFLNLCALLEEAEPGVAREAALVLGESRIPLLPVLDASGKEGAQLKMARVENRPRDASARFQKANRVVFWRKSGQEARVEIPTPPATVPIHFIAPSVIEHNPSAVEWALSRFGDEWMVAAFNGRPALFRRVAERAGDLKDERVLSVLGYLAGLLHQINAQSFQGGEDLRPRPYGAIDLSTLHQALQVYRASKDRQNTAREQLQRLQQWEHIWVPVQGEAQWACASLVVFGPSWCNVLRDFLATAEDEDQREELAPYERWAESIERLNKFRDSVGRLPDHPTYPALVPPEHPRWVPVLDKLEKIIGDSDRMLQFKALFDLLLLFGVRVGPRVEWRWANNSREAEPFEPEHRSIDLMVSEEIFQGKQVSEAVMPEELAQSKLMTGYRETITLMPYHTAFSGGHSKGNRKYLRRHGNNKVSQLAAWIWLPDFVGSNVKRPPLGGHLASVDAFRKLLLSLWPDLSAQILKTGWYSEKWGQHGRSWEKTIPSLAAFQLARLKLWESRSGGYVAHIDQRRFPVSVMVAWERDEAPSGRDQARFFPLFDASDEALSAVAHDLHIPSLNEMTLTDALLRLHWLLQESRDEESEVSDLPPGCWPIKAPGDVNRNDWLGVQYRLLERIVTADPESLWDRRAIATCGVTLRAAQVGGQTEIAVPAVTGEDGEARFAASVALFQNPPRRWDKLKYEGRWEIQIRSQLRSPLQKWAKWLGAEILENVKPPAFTGESLSTPDVQEAIGALQRQVQDRLDLILGVLKAKQVENLEQKAQQLLKAMDDLYAVDPTGTQSDGLSGLDADGRLAFSYAAYREEQDERGTGAVVLAEGLALLLEQPTAVGDLQHALTAPPQQVQLALDFRGVDVDALLGEVTSLAEKYLARLLERIQRLLHSLGAAKARPVPQPTWQTEGLIADERMKAIGALKDARGELAEQALDAIGEAAPHLSEAPRASILRTALNENLSVLTRSRSFLEALRDVGWTIGERKTFIETYLDSPIQFRREDNVEKAKNSAVLVALIDQLRTGELDGVEDPLHELENQARSLRDLITVRATESGADFIQRLRDNLKIAVPFESPDRLLIEWDEGTWDRLIQALREVGDECLQEIDDQSSLKTPEEVWSVLKRCLAEESLAPLQESRDRTWGEGQRRIRNLEHDIAQGKLAFDSAALRAEYPEIETEKVTPNTSRPGERSGGPIAGVTSDRAVRGRVAELFVLQVCWKRFLDLEKDEARRRIVDAIMSRRDEGSGEGDDHARWSTKTAWHDLEKRLERRREALIERPQEPTEVPGDLEKLFKALIEVANERGPGYDVLDPFGVWGTGQEDAPPDPDPRRVEIKAVPADTTKSAAYHIVLTTNEFHRASRDSDSYVLRLVAVPRDPEQHLDQVHWICDIPNPVQELNLAEQIGRGVRGGTLPLRLQIGN